MSICEKCRGASLISSAASWRASGILGNLLTTNIPPTPSQQSIIGETILPAIDVQVTEIDDHVASLLDAIEVLKVARVELLDTRSDHTSILSPVRLLPPEIIREIFEHIAIQENSNPIGSSLRDLAGVSAAWRAVALASTSLWSHIELDIGGSDAAPDPSSYLDLAVALRSVDGHPLNVSVDTQWELNTMDDDGGVLGAMLGLIFEYSPRWSAAVFSLMSPAIIATFLPQARPLPLLETLKLVIWETGEVPHLPSFRDAPRLHSLDLALAETSIDAPWSQIDDLTIFDNVDGGPKLLEALGVVAKCNNLRRLVFEEPAEWVPDGRSPLAVVTRPGITTLETTFAFVLDCLILPGLKEVVTCFNLPTDDVVLASLLRCITRSNCFNYLTKIECSRTSVVSSVEDCELISVLTMTPNLQTLSFKVGGKFSSPNVDSDRELVELLTALSERQFLPHLRSLTLSAVAQLPVTPYFAPIQLTERLVQRWEWGMKRFAFMIDARQVVPERRNPREWFTKPREVLTPDEAMQLEALRSDGMAIYIFVHAGSSPGGMLSSFTLGEVADDD